MAANDPASPSDTGRVVLGSLLYAAGSAIQYVTPSYLGELNVLLHINEAQMGSIPAVENSGIALASLLSILWLRRVDRRTVAIGGAVLCAVLNVIAFFVRNFELLVAVRFLAGFLGEGILFALACVVLGSTRDPDRSFGIGLSSVVAFGSLVLGTTTYLDRVPHGAGVLLPLAVMPLAVLWAVKWMPLVSAPAATVTNVGAATVSRRLTFTAIAGMTVWFAAPGAFWTFAESSAAARNIPAGSISLALALGNGLGLLGSVLAAWQGDRWGRFRPLLIATVLLCASVAAFEQSRGAAALAATLFAFNAAWNYAAVYEMALVAAFDPGGRFLPAISAAQFMGFAAGGFASGLALSAAGYTALTSVVAMLAVSGMAVLSLCFRAPRSMISIEP